MINNKQPDSTSSQSSGLSKSIFKRVIIFCQVLFILLLLIIWLSFDNIRQDKSLWVLFFYNFPSEFVIAIVPHEPVIYYFGQYYHPFIVSIVTILGTLITEAFNYIIIGYFFGFHFMEKIQQNKITTKLIDLFSKAPFLALITAGFTPIPFYPFRILVVLAHYPLYKYMLALFLSRTPRFYILATLGQEIKISDSLLIILFIVITLIIYIPLFKNRFKFRTGLILIGKKKGV